MSDESTENLHEIHDLCGPCILTLAVKFTKCAQERSGGEYGQILGDFHQLPALSFRVKVAVGCIWVNFTLSPIGKHYYAR